MIAELSSMALMIMAMAMRLLARRAVEKPRKIRARAANALNRAHGVSGHGRPCLRLHPRESVARTDLHEIRHAVANHALDAVDPTHGLGHLPDKEVRYAVWIDVRLGVDVADDRHLGRSEDHALQVSGEVAGGTSHQRAVERSTDRQLPGITAALLGKRNRSIDGCRVPRHDDLLRRVEVRRH